MERFSAERGKGLCLRERDLYLCPAMVSVWHRAGRWFLSCGLFGEGRWVQVVSGGRGGSPELWEHLNNPLSALPLPFSSRPAVTCQWSRETWS